MRGVFGNADAIAAVLFNATALILTGLSVAFAFRAGLFNIGAEGQLTVGAILATMVALNTAMAVIVRHNRRIDMLPTMLVSAALIALVSLAVRFDDLGITLKDLLLCLLWGGVLSGFANWMFIVASRHLVAAEVTLFMLLEFSLGPVWVWLFVGEQPTEWTVVGGLLVIGAVALRAAIELKGRGRRLKRGRPSPG